EKGRRLRVTSNRRPGRCRQAEHLNDVRACQELESVAVNVPGDTRRAAGRAHAYAIFVQSVNEELRERRRAENHANFLAGRQIHPLMDIKRRVAANGLRELELQEKLNHGIDYREHVLQVRGINPLYQNSAPPPSRISLRLEVAPIISLLGFLAGGRAGVGP